ncbi:MAG: HAD family hydrolase [Gammaproteobacteria bacterium]|nr:HAD family hydrolase [Gammaproteobacteria bacterium]
MHHRPFKVSTVLLDMDGTLLDLHFDDQVWNYALPGRLATRDGTSLAQAKQRVADTLARERGTLRWYCLDHWSEVFGLSLHEIEAEQAGLIGVRPGTQAFLTHLQSCGIPAVLATNAHPRSLRLKLAKTGLGPYFSAVHSSHDYGLPKEHPAFWPAFVAKVGFDPASSIFVDDNLTVLRAARAWGISESYGITRPSSTGSAREYPDFPAVDRLDELNERCTGEGS